MMSAQRALEHLRAVAFRGMTAFFDAWDHHRHLLTAEDVEDFDMDWFVLFHQLHRILARPLTVTEYDLIASLYDDMPSQEGIVLFEYFPGLNFEVFSEGVGALHRILKYGERIFYSE